MGIYERLPESHDRAVALLKTSRLFKTLPEAQLDIAAGQVIRRAYGADVTLFHQGMPGTMLYLIDTGSVRVFGVGLTGQEHTFNTFGPGSLFGELAVLDGKPRTASAITLEPSVIWLMAKEDFNRLLANNPDLYRALVEILIDRIRSTATHVETIIFQDVLGRVSYELFLLGEKHGIPTDSAPGLTIDMPLTQSDLASIVGATRESVNKALSTLRRRGLLDIDGSRFCLPDPNALLEIVGRRGR